MPVIGKENAWTIVQILTRFSYILRDALVLSMDFKIGRFRIKSYSVLVRVVVRGLVLSTHEFFLVLLIFLKFWILLLWFAFFVVL